MRLNVKKVGKSMINNATIALILQEKQNKDSAVVVV